MLMTERYRQETEAAEKRHFEKILAEAQHTGAETSEEMGDMSAILRVFQGHLRDSLGLFTSLAKVW